jgi:Protein of unknown function (DUF2851)
MKEDFLHYIWKHKKFDVLNLKTTSGEVVNLVSVGRDNLNSGPDFFNAQLEIEDQLWAGNVEIHVKSSDWFVHHHEVDKAYDNVILHVVWEHDTEVFRKDNTQIPTLELKNRVPQEVLQNYKRLFSKTQQWINCENDFAQVDDFLLNNWLERLYFERLERKSDEIEILLKQSANNWEAVLFKLLAKNFGLKVNGDAFYSLPNSFEFSVLRKNQSKPLSLEALFFGQFGVLENDEQEQYFLELQSEYKFLKQKFKLSQQGVIPLQFFRLRPPNFPTIRLSQLANLYHKEHGLFSKVVNVTTLKEFYQLFSVATSAFWETHYTFNKASKKTTKKVTKAFVNLLLINTIIPLKFSYAKHQGNILNDEIVLLVQQLTPEKNSIINKFNLLKKISTSALHSQALLQLKNEYCNKNKCLQCAVGNSIISSSLSVN